MGSCVLNHSLVMAQPLSELSSEQFKLDLSVLFGQSAKTSTIYPEKTASRLPSISHSPVLILHFRGVLCKLRPLELNFTLSEKSKAAIPCRPGEGWSPIMATGGEWEGEGITEISQRFGTFAL